MDALALSGLGTAVVAAAAWGTSDFVASVAGRRCSTTVVLICAQSIGLAVLLVLCLSVGRGLVDGWTGSLVSWAGLGGVTETVGFLALYRAMKVGVIGVVCPIAALGVVVPLVADLVGGTLPGARALIGILVAVVATLALAGGPTRGTGDRPDPGSVRLALLSAVAFGMSMLCLARAAAVDEFASGVVLRLTGLTCLVLILAGTRLASRRVVPAARRTAAVGVPSGVVTAGGCPSEHAPARGRRCAPRFGPAWWVLVAGCGIADCLGNYAYAVAVTSAPVSVASAVGSLYPAATMLLARFVLGERLTCRQRGGGVAALVGIVLMTLP